MKHLAVSNGIQLKHIDCLNNCKFRVNRDCQGWVLIHFPVILWVLSSSLWMAGREVATTILDLISAQNAGWKKRNSCSLMALSGQQGRTSSDG